jgi:predicted DNA-binding antitoxin AbrB/MazE fold protein
MSQQIDAIYDNGMLRPLAPLALPDQTRVKLTVETEQPTAPHVQTDAQKAEAEVLAKQKAALEELRREIEQIPQHHNNDGWSVRQHDELLYGSHK